MRWFLTVVALLWSVALAAQGGSVPRVNEFEQTWPVNKTNSGISAAGNVDFVPHGLTARDSDYPNIGLTDEVKVVSNLLDANTDYTIAGAVIDRGLGPVAGNGNYPDYIDANRRLIYYADYQITAASLAGQTFAVALGLHVTAGGSRLLRLALSPSGGNWLADFSCELWNEADINTTATAIATAAIQDKRIRFQFDLTPGTMDAPGDNVEDDGSLVVSMIDLDTDVETVLYTFTNRSFYLSWVGRNLGGGSTVPQNNALAVLSIGYAGLPGKNERVGIDSVSSTPAMPTPGSLIDESAPCCDAAPGSATPSAGPVMPQVGSGWTPTFAGGGTAASAAELTLNEDWSAPGVPKEPDSWLEIVEDPYPVVSPSDAELLTWGLKPLSDRGRLVEARIVEVGPIERGSSTRDGNYAPARLRVVAADDDGLIRTKLGDARKRHLYNREARYQVCSYAGRKANLRPIPAIQGRIVDVQTPLERRTVIELQDIVGSIFGTLNPEKLIGREIGDEHDNLPDATRGKIYNILLGEHSDRGAVDVEGNPASIGLVPPADCGDSDFESSPAASIVYVSPPQNLTGTLIGSGSGTREFHYAIVGLTEFGHTLMSNIVSVSGCPDSLDVDTYVELEWEPPATGAEFIIAYWVLGRTASTPNKRLDTMNNGGTFVDPELIYRDGKQGTRTDFDSEKSVNYQPMATAPASVSVWTWFAVAIGYVPILDVYGSDLATAGVPKRVLLDINVGDILTPDSDDWPEDQPYRIVGGIPQSGFWARGARVQHHRDGIVTFACNTGGLLGLNGEVIDQAFPMLLTVLNEFGEKDGLLGGTGSIGAIATFADGTPKFWTSKFEAAQAVTIAWLGGSPSKGYIGAIAITEKISLAEFIRRWVITFGGHITSDGPGRVYGFMVNPSPSSSGPLFRERMEIQKLLEQRIAWKEVENRGKYSYHYNPSTQAFRALDVPFEDATAIAAKGGAPLGVIEAPSTYDCYYGNDAETMAHRWGVLHLALYAQEPRYVRWSTNMEKFHVQNGDEVRFSHRKEGIGATGDVETPGVVMETRTLVDDDSPTYQLEHLVRLLEVSSP